MVAVAVSFPVAGYLGWRWQDRQKAGRFRESALPRVPLRAVRTGTLPRKVRESSGVAVSRAQPGVLWTHNDSGDDPEVYAVDYSGNILGEFELEGARARDWEDIALGPCPGLPVDCLYVADIGDNRRRHRGYRIYVVREPVVHLDGEASKGGVAPLGSTSFDYAGRRSEDAEAVAVAPDGEVLVITKGRSGSVQVFTLGALRAADGETTARPVATLPIEPWWGIGRVVTGAAFSADGSRLAVRTYTEVFFYARTESGGFVEAGVPCFVADLGDGGEAIDFVGDTALVLTSEAEGRRPGVIDVVTCR